MKKWKRTVPLALALLLLAGCAESAVMPENAPPEVINDETIYIDELKVEEVVIEDELVALAGTPAALPTQLKPVASGTKVSDNTKATVDYSNTKDGYVMVQFTAATDKRLKVKVFGPTTTYTYDMKQGEWTTFPLSDGNGTYQVKVYEKKTTDPADTKYAVTLSTSFEVTLTDEFAPFLRPNQYVNYENATNAIAKAQELVGAETDPLKKVEKVYSYVVNNFTYDKQRAADATAGKIPGYLPNLESVLAEKKGICFDYAAIMTGMLRSQGVPCKLVVGYAGTTYHAWVSVWSEKTGWIEGAIYFDGTAWHRMDPTFASTGNSSEKIMQYIGDGKNYNSMYFY